MKRLFTLLLFCWISGPVWAQFTAIPDPNFETFLEANGMGDGIPNNGLVLTANIENVNQLDVNQQGIADLTGIEDFSSLEYLACGMNSLTSLDVSNNLALEVLGCDFNSLIELDLSSNASLKLLYCPNNGFSTLDLSQNLQLEQVYCDENFISTLIIPSPALEWLWCNSNQITSLDLSTSPNLEVLRASSNNLNMVNIKGCEVLYDLGVGVNNLTSIDLTQNPQLLYFSCSSNNLSSLDLSQNIFLEELTTVGNNLSYLDVSQNTNLRLLRAYDNPPMSYLDIRNGNNAAIEQFNTFNNANLQCIYVDNASAGYLNTWEVHANSTFANNEQECMVLSINDINKEEFVLFPNPTRDRVHVIALQEFQFVLININGQVLKTGSLNPGLNYLDISDLSAGMYFLHGISPTISIAKKILKN